MYVLKVNIHVKAELYIAVCILFVLSCMYVCTSYIYIYIYIYIYSIYIYIYMYIYIYIYFITDVRILFTLIESVSASTSKCQSAPQDMPPGLDHVIVHSTPAGK